MGCCNFWRIVIDSWSGAAMGLIREVKRVVEARVRGKRFLMLYVRVWRCVFVDCGG
jgi:hypothetical protein